MKTSDMSVFLVGAIMLISFGGCSSFFAGASDSPPTDPLERLRYDIDMVLNDSLFRSTLPSLKVVAPSSGEVLYDRNSELYIRPASNMKLLTSSAALHILGPAYVFKTSVSFDSVASGDSVAGNLYLKGYGDPDLATSDIDTLASIVAALGIRAISGDIVVDASFFDSLQWGIGWMWDDEPAPYQAYVSGLGVNKNCVTIVVTPDSLSGTIRVRSEPPTGYIQIMNQASLAVDSVSNPIRVSRPSTVPPNTIVVSGQMMVSDEPYEETVTVLWPDLYAGTLLAEALQRRGVSFGGKVMSGRLPFGLPERLWNTTGIDSMVINLNKVSDNLSAEMTLKTLGAITFSPPGSAVSGRTAVNRFLSGAGIDTTRHRMTDGSGLSHYSLLRVSLLVDVLVHMYHRSDLFPLFLASLPVAGVDGTLSNRMQATWAEGNVRAKTGTISGVSSLSGYVRTRDGEYLAFGMTMQDFISSSARYRMAQDRVCRILAEFSREGIIRSGQQLAY